MANVEQRAEAEAQHKGLSGGAARAYVGGVFNRIRQAHAKATTPGHGARHLKRAARKEARQEASNRNERRKQLAAQERARLRTRTHSEEPRAKSASTKGRADGSNIPQLQPDYKPTEREKRNAVSLIHDPDAPQGTITLAAKIAPVKPEGKAVSTKPQEHPELKPIKDMTGRHPDPSAPVSATFLRELYGDAQLHDALDRYTHGRLREAATAAGVSASGTREQIIQRLIAKARS